MVYRTGQPVIGNTLRRSAPLLQENTDSADSIFGLDHYAFSNLDGQNGFHKKVTGPVQASHVATAANTVTLYTVQDHATIGPLQYSRGQNSAPPTPLTSLHAPTAIELAPLGTTPVLDFSGTPACYGTLIYPFTINVPPVTALLGYSVFSWTGTSLVTLTLSSSTLVSNISGNILRIRNTSASLTANPLYWTLHFDRIIS